MNCGAGCGQAIINGSMVAITCKHCSKTYNRQCLSISEEQFSALSPAYLASSACPACCVNNRRPRTNQNTPAHSGLVPSEEDSLDMSLDRSLLNQTNTSRPLDQNEAVTMNKISVLLDQKLNISLSAIIDEKLQQGLTKIVSQLRSALCEDVKKIVHSEVKPMVERLENDFTVTTDIIC